MRLASIFKRLPWLAVVFAAPLFLLSPTLAQGVTGGTTGGFTGGGTGGIPPTFTATNIIQFQSTNYFVQEDGIQALITVTRTGPLTNADIVTVDYTMLDGTAISGTHYYKSSGTLTFFPGQDRVQITVPIIDNYAAGGNVFLTLVLQNPGSGATTLALLGTPNRATLTIIDDESSPASSSAGLVEIAPGNGTAYSLGGFEAGMYIASREEWNTGDPNLRSEANFKPYGPAGVQFTIVRKGGSRGKILVDWQTTTNVVAFFDPIGFFNPFFGNFFSGGGLAVPGDDFIQTNGTVALNDYQMATNVIIGLPANVQSEPWQGFIGPNATNPPAPPVTFGVELTGVRAAPEEAGQNVVPALGSVVQRRIELVPVTQDFCFTRMHYAVREGQRFVKVRVRRSLDDMGGLGGVHVHYAVNPRGINVDFPTDSLARGGDHQGNNFPLEPGSEYSTPYVDYEPPESPVWVQTMMAQRAAGSPQTDDDTRSTITWGLGEVTDKFIVIPINDDKEAEFNEDMIVVLYKHDAETDGFVSPYAGICVIKIIDNDQPAGASEVDFDPDNDPLTDPPYITNPGANATVQAVAVQPDGKVILGGDFSSVNSLGRNHIARLNYDGSTDHNFNPGSGIARSGFVRALAVQPDGKIIVAGTFDSFNGTPRINVVRLLNNGSLDTGFNPGGGTDGEIRAVALQPDGKILIGGDFSAFDGTNINYIARLNSDGRLDTSFSTGQGPDGPVNSIAVSAAGPIELDHATKVGPAEDHLPIDTGSTSGVINISYDFGQAPDDLRIYYGDASDPNRVAIYDTGLVSSNGFISVTYGPSGAASSTHIELIVDEQNILGAPTTHALWSYHVQIIPNVDTRPVIGGEFTHVDGEPLNYIARLNTDGSVEDLSSFNPGTGADDVVNAVAKVGNEIVLAGNFTQIDLHDRRGVARLNADGTLDTDFDPGTGFDNTVYSLAIQPSGRPVLGGPFRSFNQTRRVGLARLNWDGTLDTSFMDTAKNQFAGVPNPLSPENTESQENFIRSIAPYRFTNFITVTNTFVDTNNVTNIFLSLTQQVSDHVFIGGHFGGVGGGFLRDDTRARLNIARLVGGETEGPGNISFMLDKYSVDENAGSTYITLVRTNGSLAPVSARFDASDRSPAGPGVATGGVDYEATNYFPLWIRSYDGDRQYSDAYMGPNFNAFSTNRPRTDLTTYQFPDRPALHFNNFAEDDVFVNVFDDNIVEGDELVNLTLSKPDEGRLLLGGQPIPVGTALGKAHATLTIVDNDFAYGTLGFGQVEYFVNEGEPGGKAVINIARTGGSSGAVTVDVYTQDITATAGQDYVPISKKTITLGAGQTNATFTVTINDDTIAELEESVLLWMTNATGFPTDTPAAQRLDPARSTATLWIIDNDFANGRISFTTTTNSIGEAGGQITVNARRDGGNFGDLIVSYTTRDGTAKAGSDYLPTNGLLHWTDGDSSAKSITVPIIDDIVVEANETFNVLLTSATINGIPDNRGLGAITNTVVTILNDDFPGTFSFSQPVYSVDENGGYADISVIRLGGISGAVSVHFAATNLNSIGTTNAALISAGSNGVPNYVFPQYVAANGFTNVLQFAEGQTAASFRIPIIDNSIVQGTNTIALSLSAPGGGAQIGVTNSSAVLVIIDDELNRIPAGQLDTTFQATGADSYIYTLGLQNDGKILLGGDFGKVNDVVRNRIARLNPDGPLDLTFDPRVSPNDSVRVLVPEPDGHTVIGGLFTAIGGTNLLHIARLNGDSNVDPTFDPGSGTDNPINALIEQPDGKIIIVGDFATYRNVSRLRIARISTNGVLDASFDPGTGANSNVWAVALQRDGKILIGGDFTTYNQTPRAHIARLNPNGSLDATFTDPNFGTDGSVRSIVVQSDGNILVGGLFTNVNGRPFNRLARLKSSGTTAGQLDDTFTLGYATDQLRTTNGANGAVNVIAVQLDGKILLGGDFTTFNGRTRNRLTRLNVDGSLDPTINFGSGADGPISAILVQPDRKILIAGGFTHYNGVAANHLARIHGGSISGSGELRFTSPFFSANETDSSAVVTVTRTGGTTGDLKVDFITLTNDTAIVGQDFRAVTNTIDFPEAETFRTVQIPLIRNTNALEDRFITVVLTNLVGTGVVGSQPNARVTIVNADSQIEFSRPDYSVNENSVSGSAVVTVRRLGSTVGPLSVDFMTKDVTATGGADYQSINTTLNFAPGESARTLAVPIFDDKLVEGNEQVLLVLTNLVGNGIISTPTATLTIIDDDVSVGQVEFTSDTYLGIEGSGRIVVTLRRLGGTTGVISVDYATSPGGDTPADPSSDYTPVRGQVAFADGEDTKSFIIPVIDDTLVEGNETITVTISNPKGGTSIVGPTTATAIIVDDDLPSGSLDQSFNIGSGLNGDVRTIKLDSDGRIDIGGAFTVYNNANRSRVARLNADGLVDATFDPGNGPDDTVADLQVDPDGKLILGGDFNTVQGIFANRVARLLSTGQVDRMFSLPLGVPAEVSKVVRQPDGKILIGGMFESTDAALRNHIARLTSTGTVDIAFNPGVGADANVNAIALQPDGKILIGGAFTRIDGSSRFGLARLNSDGTVDTGFNFSGGGAYNGPVQDILLQTNGSIIIVGDFSSYNNVDRARVARVNADGSLDTSFDPGVGPNRIVYAVGRQPQDGKYIIAGDFTTVSNTNRSRIARLNLDGSFDDSFKPGSGANGAILALTIQPGDGKILIGGRFTQFDNVSRNHLARLNNDKSFITPQPVSFTAVTASGGQLQLTAATQAGFSYTLESVTDLGGSWKQEQTVIAQGSTTTFSVDPTENHQFFRIRREP